MSVSLDGYIVGPDGGFTWTAPDEEVFRCYADADRGERWHPGLASELRNNVPTGYVVVDDLGPAG